MGIAMKRDDLEKEALKLSPDERARLAQTLLLSLDDLSEKEVEEAWLVEIQRRARQIDRGEVQPIPSEEVMRKARALLR
jgi:putative addiction module component (TIGR02574 family)